MNGFKKQLGFYLAILVAFFNATGISACESFLDASSLTPSHKTIEAPDYHKYWASEEIFQLTPVPQYSDSHFSGVGIPMNFSWSFPEQVSEESKASLPLRDLKSSISALIFPFHFFL